MSAEHHAGIEKMFFEMEECRADKNWADFALQLEDIFWKLRGQNLNSQLADKTESVKSTAIQSV